MSVDASQWIGRTETLEGGVNAELGVIGDVATGGEKRGKIGSALYDADGQDFVCKGGQRIIVVGLTARQWRVLVTATGIETDIANLSAGLRADLYDEGQRHKHRKAITRIFQPFFAARNVDDFDKAGLTWSLFRDFETAIAKDPDLSTANPMFARIEMPGLGRFPMPGSPQNFSASAREEPVAAPALGMHTEEVPCDIVGGSDGEIGRLFDAGVVASPHDDQVRRAA